jgi:hypothetical protein
LTGSDYVAYDMGMIKMSTDLVVSTAIFGLCAVLFALFGYLIRERGIVGLLAGYDPRKVADPEGLARFAGKLIYQMAIGTALVPILVMVLSETRLVWLVVSIGYVAFILFMCVRLIIGAQRYMK